MKCHTDCCKSCKKIILGLGTLTALLAGVLISISPAKFTPFVAAVIRFFETMLPILLAIGLLKFIWYCPKGSDQRTDK